MRRIRRASKHQLHGFIQEAVEPDSTIHTDGSRNERLMRREVFLPRRPSRPEPPVIDGVVELLRLGSDDETVRQSRQISSSWQTLSW